MKIAFSLFAMFLFSSCSTTTYFYQVYEVKSIDVPIVNDYFVFNNDDVMVRYNFCCEGGDITFYCYNKTDKIIYLQLDNSFYIHNGIAYDYFKDCDYTTSLSSTSGVHATTSASALATTGVAQSITGLINAPGGYYVGSNGMNAGRGVSRSNEIGYYDATSRSQSVTNHAPRIIAIPPHCAKYIDGFTIQDYAILKCGEDMYNQNFPKHSSLLFTYNINDTPVAFSNNIAYSFSQDGSDMQNFINNFYVSSIQNKVEKDVLEKNPNSNNDFDVFNTKKDICGSSNKYFFTITSPTVFYNKFTK